MSISIEEHLRSLDEGQLRFAVFEAQRLLEEKLRKAERLILTVEDGHGPSEKYFAASAYRQAAEFLLSLAKKIEPGPEQQATPPETVLEMLEVSLSAAGFGGLYVDGICGCKLEELSPTICLNTECTPGYLHVRSDGKAWVICSEKKPSSDQEIDGVAD